MANTFAGNRSGARWWSIVLTTASTALAASRFEPFHTG
ncbi:hypothetical protein I552_2536 [Mycobacterium xenopi 3993]|nr:hypothetical protein I552_2536 [Mycobacterium xenopi 3993]